MIARKNGPAGRRPVLRSFPAATAAVRRHVLSSTWSACAGAAIRMFATSV